MPRSVYEVSGKDSYWALSELMGDPEAGCETRVFDPNENVFTQGTPARAMFYIRSGAVKLRAISRNSLEHVARIAGPGETVGYWALSSAGVYVFTATALERTEVSVLPKEAFVAHPEVLHRLIRVFCDDMVLKEKLAFNFSKKSVRERIAGTLLLLQEKFGVETDAGIRIELSLSRKDFASLAGTVTESAVRVLTMLKEEGIVSMDGRKVIITDPAGLDRIAGDRIL